MTGWFDPPRLVSIAIRVVISTVFGEFADKREAMAGSREIDATGLDPAYDYTSRGGADFWFDYVADTGDGWNSTYAVARLLADPSLTVDGFEGALPPGRILVMGGDQVYPTASRENYLDKHLAPYDAAAAQASFPRGERPDVYAIPGNHDWYDGLSAFLGIFCGRRREDAWVDMKAGRVVGGRQTQQTRSYFAIALPHGWWLWGTDIQLDGYIDQPQVDFFTHVATHWMPEGSRLILCTAEPSWAYVDVDDPEKAAFKNFAYMESIADRAGRGHRLALVLSGDSHHYAHWTEGQQHYVVAGGGGAFLHPTHQLKDKVFDWRYPPPGQPEQPGRTSYQRTFAVKDPATGKARTFPSAETSSAITWRNLAFAYFNPQYVATLGVFFALFAWLLHANARTFGTSLSVALAGAAGEGFGRGLLDAVGTYFRIALVTPWPLMAVIAATAGYVYFADFDRWPARIATGIVHASAQLATMVLATVGLAVFAPYARLDPVLILYVGIVGSLLSSTVMGLYLLLCLNLLGRHWDEAFSALRLADYKNFLRLRIGPDGALTIHPIGLAKTPIDRQDPPRNPPLKPHLIEPPIRIV